MTEQRHYTNNDEAVDRINRVRSSLSAAAYLMDGASIHREQHLDDLRQWLDGMADTLDEAIDLLVKTG